MKKFIITNCMNLIKKYQSYDEEHLEIIEYGLTGIYLTLSKLIVILFIAILMGILKETVIFLLLYNLIRLPSFGIHATKSWICLLSSTIIFIILPIICLNININLILKLIIGIMATILMFKNSPADTRKKPIVNPKRRKIYKFISTFLAIIYVILSITIRSDFISNCFTFTLILQNVIISPITYKLFKQPYNNYKTFLKLNTNF